ncbi:hypothetical protein SAMN04488065_1510 [Haloplanus vescus]|uniref:DUF8131 domain-containing protein n=1 Tax=Haloplanus vescus TaxID=555874 RepID=A0A1H3XE01_9EURY|nr:hypothetical protein [Haloplanus vescus]SDZ97616.1 hypothetical protein SAMN04488065_1510 [Haloplanus vescus]
MVSVHRVPLVGLLALLPVAVYALSVDLIVAVALVNVVLIAGSVTAMFMPSESTAKASAA